MASHFNVEVAGTFETSFLTWDGQNLIEEI